MAAKPVPYKQIKPPVKKTTAQIADDFIKNLGKTSTNEATKAVINLLNALHRIRFDKNQEKEVYDHTVAVAEHVLKLHRIPDLQVVIESFLEANPDIKVGK